MSVRRDLALSVMLLLPVVLGLSFGFCVQDDAYISFRYAENLANGRGLVFNPGERVEGYTNLSWTVALAGAIGLGLAPEPVARAAGTASAVLVVAVVGWAAWRRFAVFGGAAVVAAAAAMGAVAADPFFALEAVQGLETAFFVLLVTACLALWIVETDEAGAPRRGLPASAAVAAVAVLTRPEGLMVFAVLELLALWRLGLAGWRRRWRGWLLVGIVFAALELFRLVYYGQPLPNTFYVKVGWSLAQWARGIDYLGAFWASHRVLVALAAIGLLTGWSEGGRWRGRAAAVAVFVVSYAFYVGLVGGDFKPTLRFLLPVLPALGLLAAAGVAVVASRSRPAAWTLVALLVAEGATAYGTVAEWAAVRRERLEQDRVAAAVLVARHPPETRMAIHAAGAIPYWTGFPTIDLWGLTQPRIAHRRIDDSGEGMAGHEKTDYRYAFLTWRPDVYVPHLRHVTPRPERKRIGKAVPDGLLDGFEVESVRSGDVWVNYFRRRGFD